MSLLDASANTNGQTNRQLYKNGRTVIANGDNNHNGNLLNNNHEQYKMDMKTNGMEKVAEEDPLTGRRQGNNDDVIETSHCGIGSCRPNWARRFASTNYFMVVFLVAYVMQGCYFTYFVGIITTIEKIFHIKSSKVGLLLSFSEMGQVCTSLFLTYFAGRGHRPRWIACGMLLFAIAAFGSVSPHFLFGSRLYDRDAHKTDLSFHDKTIKNDSMSSIFESAKLNLCQSEMDFNATFDDSACREPEEKSSPFDFDLTSIVHAIFTISLLSIGIGQTAITTLGIPYIDDNVRSKQSPLYMAITIGVRILGPLLGFYFSTFCVRFYVDLSRDVSPSDPGFIGAWWLGLFVVASTMFLASLAMFMFPRNLRNKMTQVQPAPIKAENDKKGDAQIIETPAIMEVPQPTANDKIKDFLVTIKRQLKNDILMFRTASAVLHLLPITGMYIYLPKYLETQFHMAPHDANFITGTFGILTMGVGILVTGIISVKFSLSARKVAAWIAFTALATSFGMFILSLMGCPMDNYAGLQSTRDSSNPISFMKPCETSCACDSESFSPICGSDGFSYFSPCAAGCKAAFNNDGQWSYTNCTCIPVNEFAEKSSATNGLCKDGRCYSLSIIFVAIFALTVFIHSTSEVGGMLIIMRCTHPKDKAMAMGIIQFSIGLLSNIPCPNIYGHIIDATCMVWSKICGVDGYCSLYDSDSFRKYFFGISSGIMLLAFVMDLVVFFKSHRIDIDPDANTNEIKERPVDQGEENLLNLRKISHDGDDDEHHTKIAIKDEN